MSGRGPVAVIGDGGWGTALAILLAGKGREVRLWSHDPVYAETLRSTRRNPKFLPQAVLPPEIRVDSDPGFVAERASMVLSVVPTQFLRGALRRVSGSLPAGVPVVSCSKGLERQTLLRPTEILGSVLPANPIVALSGPSHAEEVSAGLPTTVVAASADHDAAVAVQSQLNGSRFRVYTSSDVVGVEIAGAAKNVIAIAAGISDGLGFGDNARAGLITRGLREVARLGTALGARPQTFSGLSGMGDLIATCTSTHSRNYRVGFRIGRGERLADILGSTEMVAEGVETTRSVHDLARKTGVDVPITSEVEAVLFRDKPAREAVECLMSREAKGELA